MLSIPSDYFFTLTGQGLFPGDVPPTSDGSPLWFRTLPNHTKVATMRFRLKDAQRTARYTENIFEHEGVSEMNALAMTLFSRPPANMFTTPDVCKYQEDYLEQYHFLVPTNTIQDNMTFGVPSGEKNIHPVSSN